MTAHAIDLFAEIFGPADEVAAGLVRLRSSPPLWPVSPDQWSDILAAVETFERNYGPTARARGWTQIGLFGLCPHSPFARLSSLGAAWLIARTGHAVTGVDHIGIALTTRTAARLRIFRGRPDPGAVLAWSLC